VRRKVAEEDVLSSVTRSNAMVKREGSEMGWLVASLMTWMARSERAMGIGFAARSNLEISGGTVENV
jgi:hypothetical protein